MKRKRSPDVLPPLSHILPPQAAGGIAVYQGLDEDDLSTAPYVSSPLSFHSTESAAALKARRVGPGYHKGAPLGSSSRSLSEMRRGSTNSDDMSQLLDETCKTRTRRRELASQVAGLYGRAVLSPVEALGSDSPGSAALHHTHPQPWVRQNTHPLLDDYDSLSATGAFSGTAMSSHNGRRSVTGLSKSRTQLPLRGEEAYSLSTL